jgi:hypothetical protein
VVVGARQLKDPLAQARLELALAGLGAYLLKRGVTPLFVPFSRHPLQPLEDDAAFARRLIDALGGGALLDGEHHPREVLGIVREAEAVVAVRFHALVFALRAARPVVALPYDAKCADLLAERGLRGVPPGEVTARGLVHRIAGVLDARPRAGLLPAEEGRASDSLARAQAAAEPAVALPEVPP